MDRTFLQLDTNDDIKAVLHSERMPGPTKDPEVLPPDFIEVTSTVFPSGITNWNDVSGHHYDRPTGDITAPTKPPPTRQQELKEKITWTQAEKDEAFDLAIRRLL